ncbi:MAG: hypothetical protein LRY41_01845 [Candidatus Pacebacteria bacterium]|nr:hypothetical protein [Candidatus Paceibacterota bacterium]MCD8508321.1 hypothetical protein [Candidatus Paceibacterota bacterium]MCD8528053.1 hypothetical protein [Candidatus Paceibacterota bacterium]MCD8564059.1 hypothetical protein [Candidatus Paceibacterota bacterium]
MITILGKIELPENNRKKREVDPALEKLRTRQDIDRLLTESAAYWSNRANERFAGCREGKAPLLDHGGSIMESSFADVYDQETVDFDTENVFQQKRGFYNTYKKEVQEKYGTSDEREIVSRIEQESRTRDGALAESMLFVLLSKGLPDRYMVVRSSAHDDYINGADMLLLDTETGSVICAFDDTVEGHQSRLDHKVMRAKKKLTQGRGVPVKYGISITQRNNEPHMYRGVLRDVPPLFLAVAKKELEHIMHTSAITGNTLDNAEKNFLQKIIQSAEGLIDDLEDASTARVSYDAVRTFVANTKAHLAQ